MASFVGFQVLGNQWFGVFVQALGRLGRRGCCQALNGLLLVLLGLVIEQNPNCHQDSPDGREAGDLVAKHDDA